MKTVHAIYEGGVFRPTAPVDLPEHSQVQFEPRVIDPTEADLAEKIAKMDPGRARIYEILSRRYDGGEHDVAERHNEHLP
jgi:predicted DNA-binding antitoxin AbrB/MazE fold protein